MIEVEVRLEERDLVTAHREVAALRRAMAVMSTIGLALIVGGGTYFVMFRHNPLVAAFQALVLSGLGGFLLWRARTRGSQQWKALPAWRTQVRYVLSRKGLRIDTDKEVVELTWDRVAGWSETESAFYVEQAGQVFQIVPKRAFSGAEAVDAARSLLRDHVRERPELRGRR